MSNFDSKIGEGVSKLQDGLQQGKQKLQNAQEASKVKKTISQLSNQKGKLLIDLGQAIYLEYRKGNIVNEAITSRAANIKELDVELFEQLALLNEYNTRKSGGHTCECGATLSEADHFCPSCGTKVTKPEDEVKETKLCTSCNNEMPVGSNFCNACGSRS